jgi:hypothetical protein
MKYFQSASFVTLLAAALMFLAGCNNNSEEVGTGRLTVQLTDAPFPSDMVAEANVTISRIEARNKGAEDDEEGEEDGDSGSPFVVLSEETQSFNLLDLQNGVTASLVDLEVPVGSYDLVRLYVDEASIVLTDGQEFDLFVPSGAQTGIKIFINPAIEVAGGLTAELLLDFDVANSFISQGSLDSPSGINGFNFRPTIKAANLSTAGRIQGVVTDSLDVAASGATVSIFAADTLNTTAIADENGAYAVLGLTAGTYDVTVEYSEYQPLTVEAVDVVAANATTVDLKLEE